MIAVVGGGLAGLAAAARLSRAGHEVVVLERDAAPCAGVEVATEPGGTVLTLPAAWRDLFRKSGRVLASDLRRRGLQLVAAPPRRYRLADGSALDLPTDRGAQWTTLAAAYGEPVAASWRDLLDELDGAWLVLRRYGLEEEFSGRLGAADRAVLVPRRSLDDLARRVPELAELVLDVAARLGQDPRRLPGWHAYRLGLERTFGRWQVVDAEGAPQPATVLLDLLLERLDTRGVEVRTGVEVLAIRPDRDGHRLESTAGSLLADAVVSTVDPATHADLTHERADFRVARHLRRAPGGGPRWTSWRTLLDLPPLQPAREGVAVASPWSPGGTDSWAQLLTGALAAYRLHEQLTGEDIRPTNRDYRITPGR